MEMIAGSYPTVHQGQHQTGSFGAIHVPFCEASEASRVAALHFVGEKGAETRQWLAEASNDWHSLARLKLSLQRWGISVDLSRLGHQPYAGSGFIFLNVGYAEGPRTHVYCRLRSDSPLQAGEEGHSVSPLRVNPNAPPLSSSGEPFGLDPILGNMEPSGHLAVTVTNYCVYVATGQRCSFCAIDRWSDSGRKSRGAIAKALAEAVESGAVRHVSLTTGSLRNPDAGVGALLATLRAARDLEPALGRDVPVAVEFEPPKSLDVLRGLAAAGVSTVAINVELFDERTRARQMPGKSKHNTWTDYLKAWDLAADELGRGQVFTNVLMTRDEVACSDPLSGFQDAVRAGAIPSPGVIHPEPSLRWSSGHEPPSLETQDALLVELADILHSEGLDSRHARAGCHRSGSYSALNEYMAARDDLPVA